MSKETIILVRNAPPPEWARMDPRARVEDVFCSRRPALREQFKDANIIEVSTGRQLEPLCKHLYDA